VFISYGCHKEEAGSEFAGGIGKESFPGKVPLKKGRAYAVTVRLTKKVAGAMRLRSPALIREKGRSTTDRKVESVLMFEPKMWLTVIVLSAPLLSAPAGLAAPKPPAAEVRFPVEVSIEDAWARMAPHVYLADLNPSRMEGLRFDRKTKSAISRDIRPPKEKEQIIKRLKERCRRNNQKWNPDFYRLHGNPIMRVRGTAVYPLRPEYKYFSWRTHHHVEVHVDGKKLGAVVGRNDDPSPGDHRFPKAKGGRAQMVRIPPGGKTFTIKADAGWIKQAGFLTQGPTVARVEFHLSGYDPTSLIPLVYTASGRRVGCRIPAAAKSSRSCFWV